MSNEENRWALSTNQIRVCVYKNFKERLENVEDSQANRPFNDTAFQSCGVGWRAELNTASSCRLGHTVKQTVYANKPALTANTEKPDLSWIPQLAANFFTCEIVWLKTFKFKVRSQSSPSCLRSDGRDSVLENCWQMACEMVRMETEQFTHSSPSE